MRSKCEYRSLCVFLQVLGLSFAPKVHAFHLNNTSLCHAQINRQGNIDHAMALGIDESDVVVVFITKKYIEKCKSVEAYNCKREFLYAWTRKKNLVPVVMENAVIDTSTWNGPVGLVGASPVLCLCLCERLGFTID